MGLPPPAPAAAKQLACCSCFVHTTSSISQGILMLLKKIYSLYTICFFFSCSFHLPPVRLSSSICNPCSLLMESGTAEIRSSVPTGGPLWLSYLSGDAGCQFLGRLGFFRANTPSLLPEDETPVARIWGLRPPWIRFIVSQFPG